VGAEPAFLTREQRRVEVALEAISHSRVPGLPEPLRAPLAYALSTTGKRLRPVLCVTAYQAATRISPVPDQVYLMSCALEIVHTYSLIHDDLPCMDDDDLRRGRPTLHRVYGTAIATIAGAALLPLATEVLDDGGEQLGLSPEERGVLVFELTWAAGAEGMVGGQLLDLRAEQREVAPDELERIHGLKTGALLTASLRIGALAGHADPPLLAALTIYGKALGLAFQITDDLLDVEGSSAVLGKEAGRDSALKKASYPAFYGVDGARKLAKARVEEAKHALDAYDLCDLIALADYVVERRK